MQEISYPLEAGFKSSSMMGRTEVATVKGPVLNTRVSGFSVSGDTGGSIGGNLCPKCISMGLMKKTNCLQLP